MSIGNMDSLDKIDSYISGIKNRDLHKVSALIKGLIYLVILFVLIDVFLSKYFGHYTIYLYSSIVLMWVCFWLHNKFWIKKSKKGSVGIIISIYSDSVELEENMKRDFINSIKINFEELNINNNFDIVVVKNHVSVKYGNRIKELYKKVGGHFYVFGEIKKIKSGTEKISLSLNGMVMHRPVSGEVSEALAKNFTESLQKNVKFEEIFSFDGFNDSANMVTLCAKYILGIASFISYDSDLAISLHEEVKREMENKNNKTLEEKNICKDLYNLLSAEYALASQYAFLLGNKDEAIYCIEKSLLLDNNNFIALNMKSIILFKWDRNIKDSMFITKRLLACKYPEPRYNEAFLYFYEGKYKEAIVSCDKLKNQKYINELSASIESTNFTLDLLKDKKENNPALYFWLGFNFYFKQNNITEALKFFNIFLESKNNLSLKILVDRAIPCVKEIEKTIGL